MGDASFSSFSRAQSERSSQQLHEPLALKQKRARAFAEFESLPFPEYKYGLDIRSSPPWMDFSLLAQTPISPPTSIATAYYKELGNGAFMCDLATAFRRHTDLVSPLFSSLMRPEQKMHAMHLAFVNQGFFIYLPENVHVQKTISVPFSWNSNSQFFHLLVRAESHTQADILFSPAADASAAPLRKPQLHSHVIEIFAAPHARIHAGGMQDLPAQDVFLFSHHLARVDESAHVDWEWIERGAQFAQAAYSSTLVSPRAASHNNGMIFSRGDQMMDIHQAAHHTAPNTDSFLRVRGALDDASKCVYRGLLRMEAEATQANGTQSADLLLLSPQAEADPVPALETFNSNVRCAHAATVGRLDREKLFYITSRGVSEDVARSLVMNGFWSPLKESFLIPEMRVFAERLMDASLSVPAEGASASHAEVRA